MSNTDTPLQVRKNFLNNHFVFNLNRTFDIADSKFY